MPDGRCPGTAFHLESDIYRSRQVSSASCVLVPWTAMGTQQWTRETCLLRSWQQLPSSCLCPAYISGSLWNFPFAL